MAQLDVEAKAVEAAEKKRNDTLKELLAKQNDFKLADIDGKFIVIKDVTDSGDIYVDNGDLTLILGVVDGNVYRLTNKTADFEAQVADPTKGELVVELDKSNKKINWLQDHVEQQPFETFNSLRTSKYTGDDAGYPLVQAVEAYVHGTFNISGYDTRVVTAAELIADIKDGDAASATPVHSDAPASASQTPVQTSQAANSASSAGSSSSHSASSANSNAGSAVSGK